MKISLRKNLDALRGDALLRLDRIMRARRDAVDPGAALNADVRAAKLAEARLVIADVPFRTPLLDREAADTGQRITAIAWSVVVKAEMVATAIAAIEAQRQAAQAAIRVAPTPAAIEAVINEIEAHHG